MSRPAAVVAAIVAFGAAAGALVALRAAPTEPPAPPLPPGWGEVVVLGRGDAPIQGVTLAWEESGPAIATTDAHGVARFDLPQDSVEPAVFLGGTLDSGNRDETYQVLASRVGAHRTVVRLRDAIPIDVTFFDALTGRPVRGGSASWRAGPRRSASDPSDPTIRGLVRNDPLSTLLVAAPDGYTIERDWVDPSWVPAGFVERQDVRIPAWPAGTLQGRVIDSAGVPAPGPLTVSWTLGSGPCGATEAVADADGRFQLRTVPLIPDARIRVSVERDRHRAGDFVRVAAGVSSFDAEFRLPTEPEGGRCAGCRSYLNHADLPPGGNATLRVRVLRRDGTPAPRVHVVFRGSRYALDPYERWETTAVTDDDGLASRSDLSFAHDHAGSGGVTVILSEPGMAYTTMEVPLAAGGKADCELRESVGEEIALTVVDADGRPVPWAHVSAQTRVGWRWSWAPVEGAVAGVAPCTDRNGHVVLRGVPSGDVEVRVDSCGRFAERTCVAGRPATIQLIDR
jgi:hypothetical protein